MFEANQDEPYIKHTENNERIHSFIAAHNKNDLINNATNYSDEVSRHINSVHGTINSTLSLATQKAGLSNELILQLTNIFAWDIDFATNLHHGDQFTVVYEETRIGNNSSDSQIVAAEFVNQGRILTAIRYKDSEGNVNYYSPDGKPMRKAFLSTPVDFVRISSGFDTHRRHPILNRIRAHKGVDYAARMGTPVKSAGDGEVTFRGRKGGYGQVMIVKHGEHYETLYAHLSDFKEGLESGDLVKQGEIIGYVGQTGLATGPHLHYEFRVDGVHRNPETLNLAQSYPLHAEVLADFKAQTQPLLAQLNNTKAKSLFAKNQYDYN
ncbi:MAG: peptidoglycan DD-metalloendopeptidase family protein [Methylococcaceae bacterium]|nr:peptidoglycan DD-metalloendopeptidase family protein [Methylococcaceae bacterium]